jgi:hypothetical protein
MREFMHGNEWWGQRDDGTWVRWNNQTLEWDPQAQAPPPAEMQEVTPKPPSGAIDRQTAESGAAPAAGASATQAPAVDPVTGLPLPPGSKVYSWETRKTFGTRSDQMEPGAKTFQWRLGKKFGPFPLEGKLADPNASPEELSRAAFRMASLKVRRTQLWLSLILAALVLGGLAFMVWLVAYTR